MPTTANRVRLGIARTLQNDLGLPGTDRARERARRPRSLPPRTEACGRTALATPQARREQAAAEAAALEALALVGLEREADVLTPELTTSQRRLVALAAALATEPQVLLVDELAVGCRRGRARRPGASGRPHPWPWRRRAASSSTISASFAASADRVFVLAAGSLIAEGSAAQVAASGAVQEAYLGTARL